MSREEKPRMRRRIARMSLYAIPGYPILKAIASLKATAATGLKTIVDQNRELTDQRKNPRTSSFNDAMARRSEDALPLESIERNCLRRKQFYLAAACIALSFVTASALGGNYYGSLLGLMFMVFCGMFMIKHEHQIWQLETGRAAPDAPLGGFKEFFASKGMLARLLNPRL